jgi:hypothetical protein
MDKRKIAQLTIFPNFLRYAPKTSFIPDVVQNLLTITPLRSMTAPNFAQCGADTSADARILLPLSPLRYNKDNKLRTTADI